MTVGAVFHTEARLGLLKCPRFDVPLSGELLDLRTKHLLPAIQESLKEVFGLLDLGRPGDHALHQCLDVSLRHLERFTVPDDVGGGPAERIIEREPEGGLVLLGGSVSSVVLPGTPQQPFGFTGPDIPGGDPLTPTLTLVSKACDPCDMNCDGTVDASDIEPFIGLLFEGDVPCAPCTGDTNGDGFIDAADIEGFINCLFP